jgi:hypothetical protein
MPNMANEEALANMQRTVEMGMLEMKEKIATSEEIDTSAQNIFNMFASLNLELAKLRGQYPTINPPIDRSPTSMGSFGDFSPTSPTKTDPATPPLLHGQHSPVSMESPHTPSSAGRRRRPLSERRSVTSPLALDVGDKELGTIDEQEQGYHSRADITTSLRIQELEAKVLEKDDQLHETKRKLEKEKEQFNESLLDVENALEAQTLKSNALQESLDAAKASNITLERDNDALGKRLVQENEKDAEILDLEQKLKNKKRQADRLEEDSRRFQEELSTKQSQSWALNKAMEDLTLKLQETERNLAEALSQQQGKTELLDAVSEQLIQVKGAPTPVEQQQGISTILMQISESVDSIRANQPELDSPRSPSTSKPKSSPKTPYRTDPAQWTPDIWAIVDRHLESTGLKIYSVDQIQDRSESAPPTPSLANELKNFNRGSVSSFAGTVSSASGTIERSSYADAETQTESQSPIPASKPQTRDRGANTDAPSTKDASVRPRSPKYVDGGADAYPPRKLSIDTKARRMSDTNGQATQAGSPVTESTSSLIRSQHALSWPNVAGLVNLYSTTNDGIQTAAQHLTRSGERLYTELSTVEWEKAYNKIPSVTQKGLERLLQALWRIVRILGALLAVFWTFTSIWTLIQSTSEVGAFGLGGPEVDNGLTRLIYRFIVWWGSSQIIWT